MAGKAGFGDVLIEFKWPVVGFFVALSVSQGWFDRIIFDWIGSWIVQIIQAVNP